jgi:hypothetical protein
VRLGPRGSLAGGRASPALVAVAVRAPHQMLPLLQRPQLVLAAAAIAIALLLAWASPAYPLGLVGIAFLVPLAGPVTLPEGAVVAALVAWLAAGVLFKQVRGSERAALPVVLAVPGVL